MQFEEIKSLVQEECARQGITFIHSDEPSVSFNGMQSNGYFDEASMTLALGTTPHSLEILVHEYCHMQQFLYQDKVWTDLEDAGQIWEWLEGTDFPEEVLDKSFKAYYHVELDCEMNAVEHHKEWETGINLDEYIQKANAYTLFYLFMREHRVWYETGREPYTIKAVWTKMPKTFAFDRLEWYNKLHQLFELCI